MSIQAKPHLYKTIIAFALVYTLWGATFLFIHYATQDLGPNIISGLRYFLSAPFLFLYCRMQGMRLSISRKDFWRIGCLGILTLVGNNSLLVWAERMVDSGLAALILAVIPIMIALLDMLIPGGEKLHGVGWVGLVMGFAGLSVLLTPSLQTARAGDMNRAWGSMILIVSGLCWALGSVLLKRSKFPVDPMVVSAWQMFTGGGANLLIATAIGSWQVAHWSRMSIISLAYLTIPGALIALTAFNWLLHHVPVAKVATYAYVNPIVAVILGAVILHERLHTLEWIGMVVILTSVALVNISKVKPTTLQAEEA